MVWLYNSFSCVRGRILIGVIRRGMSFHHFLVCMNTSNSLRAYRLTGGSELPSPQRSIIGPLLCNGMRWSLINPFDVGVRIDIYFPHSFFLLACHNRKKGKWEIRDGTFIIVDWAFMTPPAGAHLTYRCCCPQLFFFLVFFFPLCWTIFMCSSGLRLDGETKGKILSTADAGDDPSA